MSRDSKKKKKKEKEEKETNPSYPFDFSISSVINAVDREASIVKTVLDRCARAVEHRAGCVGTDVEKYRGKFFFFSGKEAEGRINGGFRGKSISRMSFIGGIGD